MSAEKQPNYNLRRAVVGGVAVAAAAGGGVAATELHHGIQETRQQMYIQEDPAHIPEGHAITLDIEKGDGTVRLGRRYGADGHIEDLQAEIAAQYPDGLPYPGEVKVYDNWVDPEALPKQEP